MRRLRALLSDTTELRTLLGHASGLTALQKIWGDVVPPPLREFTQAGGLKHRRITVFASNGAVAARVKLLAPSLLKNLQNKGLEVTSIRVEVQVKSVPARGSKPPRQLSRNAASSLRQLAESLPDSPLRDALRQLAGKAST